MKENLVTPSQSSVLEAHLQAAAANVPHAIASGDRKKVKDSLEKLKGLLDLWTEAQRLEAAIAALGNPPQAAVSGPTLKLASPTPAPAKPVSAKPAKVEIPKPAADPNRGKPRRLPPEVPSEAELARQKVIRLQNISKSFFDESKSITGLETWSDDDRARAKALICFGRQLEEDFAPLEPGYRDLVRDELRIIARAFEAKSGEGDFFGLNWNRKQKSDQWDEAAKGYRLLPAADLTARWLTENPTLSESQRTALLEMAAASEAYLHRVFEDHALNVWDQQQREIHQKIEALEPGATVTRYWRTSGDMYTREELFRRALGLEAEIQRVKASTERAEASKSTTSALEEWLQTVPAAEFDVDHLVRLVRAVLEAGTPPSSKPMRQLLLGYRHFLEESDDKSVRKLVEYLRSDAMLAAKKGMPEEEPEEEINETVEAQLKELRPITTGKTVLFVGGNKGQNWRKKELMESMGLIDVIWPNAEEQTRPEALASNVAKADIVCLLIRFSRHSFKQVLDHAKENGKLVVTLPRGLGTNTIIHEMHSQLTGASKSAVEA